MSKILQTAVFFFIVGFMIGAGFQTLFIQGLNSLTKTDFAITNDNLPIIKNREHCVYYLDKGPTHTAVHCVDKEIDEKIRLPICGGDIKCIGNILE